MCVAAGWIERVVGLFADTHSLQVPHYYKGHPVVCTLCLPQPLPLPLLIVLLLLLIVLLPLLFVLLPLLFVLCCPRAMDQWNMRCLSCSHFHLTHV
jgi:hypothetical protein